MRVALWSVLVVYFAAAALILGLRYWVLPNVASYVGVIEQAVSRTIGERVTIGAIRAGWQGLQPELDLTDVRIHDRAGRLALSLPVVEATVSWASVVYGTIRFHSLVLERPDLAIRRDTAGSLFVAGMELKDDVSRPDATNWLLSQRELVIRDARLTWDDEHRAAPRLVLSGVTFAIHNSGDLHRFALRAQAPKELASALDVRGELRGTSLEQLRDWTGRLFAELDYVDLAAWQSWFDYPMEIRSGRGGLRLWLAFAGKRLTEATADVALGEVGARLARNLPLLELDYLEGRLGVKESRGALDVYGKKVALKAAAVSLPPADFGLHWEPGQEGRQQRGELQANALDLHALAALAEFLPFPQKARAQLAEMDPYGSVFDLKLVWTGAPELPQSYGVRGRFAGLGARAWLGIPAFQGLSGSVDGNERDGNVFINSEKLTVELPGIFADPRMQFDTFSGQVKWSRAKDRIELKFADLALANAQVAGTLFGSFETKEGSPGIIDLSGSFARADAPFVYRYIPRLPRPVLDYLTTAVQGGKASEVKLRLKGDLKHFPFEDPRHGTFRVAARLADVDLAYAEGWPRLSGLAGTLVFEGKHMNVFAQKGSVLGARISNTKAVIADLFHDDEVLQVEGQAEGPTPEFLRFVAASPVSQSLDGFTEGMSASGSGRLQLKLSLPLRRLDEAKVAGNYQLLGNQLAVDADIPPFSQVNGRIDFTDTGISARDVTAQFLGGQTTVSFATRSDGTIAVNAQGTATVAGLRRHADIPLLDRARGGAAWRGSISIKKRAFEMAIESTLQGVAINLPAPLGKNAAETMPLKVERTNSADGELFRSLKIQRLPPRGDATVVLLGRALNAVFLRTREGDEAVIERGALAFNQRSVLPERPGIAVEGTLPYVNFDQWRALVPAGGASLPMSTLNLRLGVLDVVGKRLNDLAIRASVAEGGWAGSVSAKELEGDLTWRPEGRGRIVARLKRLTVPDAAPGAAAEEPPDRELPALDIVADNFVARERNLGKLDLVAVNRGRDWRIEKLLLSSADSTLNAEGFWQSWAARPSISMNVKLDVSDVGHYLERMGYPGTMRNGVAKLQGKVGWAGNPQSVDFPTLTGHVTLEVEKGQFLKTEPGITKLLGILSLQSLLTFDLRDLFREGFAFDKLSGTAQISKGVLSTKDFSMHGASAQVSMSGDIDLEHETQNLRIRVVPSLGDSASTVATLLLANPIAGIGALIAQRILKDPLGQIFAFEYDVTGTWAEPKVQKVRQEYIPEPVQQ
ncbi:MAG: TIGR02099 family protein [Betaproteobacteria bacterium]|nr:TIGR02099 family protein [Betaproteobacteria bacterium]